MIIPSVGKPKILYKNHEDIEFESLEFYVSLAQKIIAKLGFRFFGGLSKQMLKNEDAISFVANAIMMGDWRWEQKNIDPIKTRKTLYSYRNQCAIWAIKTYITKTYKNKYNRKKINEELSINYQNDNMDLESIIKDNKQKEPIEKLIDKEKDIINKEIIKNILDLPILSEKQKQYIQLYYFENMTLEKIGDRFNITREAVRQSIKSAIQKIKSLV
jgi:RNA polymerase sigma factor (sigma-70 family)